MPVDTKYYSDLDITPGANAEQIASAFRRLSLQYHPLRNSSAQTAFFTAKFSAVCEAYEVLSSPAWKDIYDRFGMQSLKNGVNVGENQRSGYVYIGNPFKIFFDFFGSENPWFDQIEQTNPMAAMIHEAEQKARAEDVEVAVDCTLYEFYNGALKTVTYQVRQLFKGSDETTIADKTIDVVIKPGYSKETTLRFPRMGHEAFGAHPSDLVVSFNEKPSEEGFVRDGDDLIYFVGVSLVEALEQMPSKIKTLDGRSILVTPNEMITPQTKVILEGEGMPSAQTGNFLGDAQEQLQPI